MANEDTLTRVPLLDLTPELEAHGAEFREAMDRVVESGRFILGPEVRAFEEEVAEYLGVEHAVGVNSGTDALVIGLRSLGIGPGDEVITSPFTFFATAESISMVGAHPVFVDIESDSFNLDPRRVEDAITERTRAILPVHLFGWPAPMDAILEIAERHDLLVLEDCAQSFGALVGQRRTGSLGHAGAFSFFPSKNLGAFGDAGLVATSDERIAEMARMLRAHGGKDKYHNEMLGYNSRLDALQAAILRVKLGYVDESNALRRKAAGRYEDLLSRVTGVATPQISAGHVFHQYTLRITGASRDEVRRFLASRGISSAVYYPVPCHCLPVYRESNKSGVLPVAEEAAAQVLSLPIWPGLTQAVQETVATAIRRAVAE